jgi:phage terminase large subunit GpA-like protein
VPCPHCGKEQILLWGGVDCKFGIKWDAGQPKTAHYVCEHCACVIEEMWKDWMNERGRWIAENPGHDRRGFWTNALISPWARWADLVKEWVAIHANPIRLRQFVNTVLCETWEDKGVELDANLLKNRRRRVSGEVPFDVGVLTCGVDVQGDRIEADVWGWGVGEEAWFIHHEFIIGDPATPEPWKELETFLKRTFAHETGAKLGISATFVDSGGHHTKEVYAFTKKHVKWRVFAIKGSSIQGHPVLGPPKRSNSAKAILYQVGVFTIKESLMKRFEKIIEAGPGFIHLPVTMDDESVAQLDEREANHEDRARA